MESKFEFATRTGLRFKSSSGLLTTEDLWNLDLKGALSLNSVAQHISKEIKAASEESFVEESSTDTKINETRLEIVKHIIKYKLDRIAAAEKAQVTRTKNARIQELIARKKDQELESLSVEELEAMVDS